MSLIPTPPPSEPTDIKRVPTGPPVMMKMRSDLTYHRQAYQGVEYWVVKEPLGQKYYQFPPHVFHILRQLDGHKTVDQLIDNYHDEHAPKRITRSELQQLLTRFHKDGLVISDRAGQGSELLKRGRHNLFMETFQQMSNILAIRYRGFDPERILNFLIRWTWWFFTAPMVVIVMIMAAIALLSVLMNFAEFQARLPGFQAFFDPSHWLMFAGVMCVTKVLHEFGHGLSCKRLGGECHEIGFMLLVLTPCLYCNVSDSWRLTNKWHRAAIGAAGIYVEVFLATLATFVWWFVQPGFIQDVCLQVMLISSISTILFNGNPLLRFDGYYIMSDVLEIPNLQQKSTKALTTLLGRHWLGLEIPDDQLMPQNRPWAFAMFTVAAFLYRWFILFAIITFLTIWLEPYGLETLGIGIAAFAVAGMLGWPLYRLYRYMSVPGRMHQVKKMRFFVSLGVAVALLAALFLFPFKNNLRCSLIVVPKQLETIYVKEPGLLDKCFVKGGDIVEANDVLATLRNSDVDLRLNKTESQLSQELQRRDLAILGGASFGDDKRYLEQLPTIDAEIKRLTALKASLQLSHAYLTLKSPIAGTVIETPYQHAGQKSEIELLDPQSFLSNKNLNVAAMRQQRFCEIADMSEWHAVVLLTEDQIDFASVGQNARIKLYVAPGKVIETTVIRKGVSDRNVQRDNYTVSTEQAMQMGGLPDLVAEMVAMHQQTDIQYYARVELPIDDELRAKMKIGLGGEARLQTPRRSLGARIWWWFNQNFRS